MIGALGASSGLLLMALAVVPISLLGVERRLRQEGFQWGVLEKPAWIWTLARIADIATLRRMYSLPAMVGFTSSLREEFSENGCCPHEVKEQSLYCKRCDSVIRFNLGPAFPAR